MKNLAIFASGSGTNAENVANYFNRSEIARVKCILTNNPKAFVIERAEKLNVDTFVFNRDDFYNTNNVINYLITKKVDFIVLAGFLWLVPSELIKHFKGKIINIHPALLPKYGGKGMYGMRVHETVVENREKESGITIHHVNEKYDEGNIIFQTKCPIKENDTPEDVANKIHKLEYEHFPKVIEKLLIK